MSGPIGLATPATGHHVGGQPQVRHHHVGPDHHGVTRFGLELATALRRHGGDRTSGAAAAVGAGDSGAVSSARARPGVRALDLGGEVITHLQFTDNLWGPDAGSAAAALLYTVAALSGPVVVTLHDLPDPQDVAARWSRRAAAYAAVARRAEQVVVCSAHEAARLRAVAPDVHPVVIPNPLPATPGRGARTGLAAGGRGTRRPRTVGVLGWIFPGKGHERVIDAVAGRVDLHVVALGAIAPGHDAQFAALRLRADRAGVLLSATGWLHETRQLQLVRSVDVPIAPHPRPSASGSMLAWIAGGRRPLVRRSPYAEELRARAPGTVTLYEPADLRSAVESALAVPASTVLDPTQTHPELDPATAAARHLHLYRQLAGAVT